MMTFMIEAFVQRIDAALDPHVIVEEHYHAQFTALRCKCGFTLKQGGREHRTAAVETFIKHKEQS